MINARKLTVIVVDDEKLSRQELGIFDWEKQNMSLVAEATNGCEAIELCRRLKPDIVITDITMPVMDGVALLKQIKKEKLPIQVIILTCHSDFEYARQALRLGAIGYILKSTMDTDELEHMLDKARTNIENADIFNNALQEKNHREKLRTFVELSESPTALKGFFESIGVDMTLPLKIVALCISSRQQDWALISPDAQTYISKIEPHVWWMPGPVGQYYLIIKDKDTTKFLANAHNVALDLEKYLRDSLPYLRDEVKVFCVIGPTVNHYNELIEICEVSGVWSDYFFYNCNKRVVNASDISLKTMDDITLTIFDNEIQKHEPKAVAAYIRDEFAFFASKHKLIPDQLKVYAFGILSQYYSRFDFQENHQDMAVHIMKSNSLERMISVMVFYLERVNGYTEIPHPQIRAAKKIIASKLKEPISLRIIASDVGLSPNYLSRLFAENLGEGFHEYVTRQRMEKAMVLLKSTNLKIYEVAEQVGIPSYRHFSLLFREWKGMGPKEFKRNG